MASSVLYQSIELLSSEKGIDPDARPRLYGAKSTNLVQARAAARYKALMPVYKRAGTLSMIMVMPRPGAMRVMLPMMHTRVMINSSEDSAY